MRKMLLVAGVSSAFVLLPTAGVLGATGDSIDISVASGETGVVVFSGNWNVCGPTGANCSTLSGGGCGTATISASGVNEVGDAAKTDFIAENFPFAVDEEPLAAEFQVGSSGCLTRVRGLIISPDEPGAIPRSGSPN